MKLHEDLEVEKKAKASCYPFKIFIYGTTSTGKTLAIRIICMLLTSVGVDCHVSDHELFKGYDGIEFENNFKEKEKQMNNIPRDVHIYAINDNSTTLRMEFNNMPYFLLQTRVAKKLFL